MPCGSALWSSCHIAAIAKAPLVMSVPPLCTFATSAGRLGNVAASSGIATVTTTLSTAAILRTRLCATPAAAGSTASGNSATKLDYVPGPLDVDAGGERILLDEQPARFDQLAHQFGEDVVGILTFLDLQQRARVHVERGFPQLLGIHFAEAFVALHHYALAPCAGNSLK